MNRREFIRLACRALAKVAIHAGIACVVASVALSALCYFAARTVDRLFPTIPPYMGHPSGPPPDWIFNNERGSRE